MPFRKIFAYQIGKLLLPFRKLLLDQIQTAKFEAVTDSGENVRAACRTDGGRVRFAIPPFSKSGRSKAAYVRLEKDGAVVTTNDMEVMVL